MRLLAGFTGRLCETQIDDCESDPCLNNGLCATITTGYDCTCQVGYFIQVLVTCNALLHENLLKPFIKKIIYS